jgi:hypothetical protein
MKIYLIGSLRNTDVRNVAWDLRRAGHEVFDDWHTAGPEADDIWQTYEKERGRSYTEALAGSFATHAFEYDAANICRADAGVLIMPAGKSAHLELGFMLGLGKLGYILLPDGEPERWDLMYKFADGVFYNLDDLIEELNA